MSHFDALECNEPTTSFKKRAKKHLMDNSDKSENQSSKGFWSTLPGVLTGTAGVIGSVTALIIGLKEVGFIGHSPTPTPSTSVPEGTATSTTPSTSTPAPSVTASPSNSSPTPPKFVWEFMGSASTGESISVNVNSISKSDGSTEFEYRIGNELISANADCVNNRWHANDYDWYSPQSEATQNMLNFICNF